MSNRSAAVKKAWQTRRSSGTALKLKVNPLAEDYGKKARAQIRAAKAMTTRFGPFAGSAAEATKMAYLFARKAGRAARRNIRSGKVFLD